MPLIGELLKCHELIVKLTSSLFDLQIVLYLMLKCYIKNEVPDEKTVRVKKVGETKAPEETVMKNPKIGEKNKCNQS